MSRRSILFLNNPFNYDDKATHKFDEKAPDSKGTYISLNSDSASSSCSQTLDEDFNTQEDFREDFPDSPKRKSRAERKPQVVKFLKYLQDYKKGPSGSDRILLSSLFVSRDKNEAGQSWSLNNFENGVAIEENSENRGSIASSNGQEYSQKEDEIQFTKPQHNHHHHEARKIPLISQFRRKSCHCSDCGGQSKFEMKVQDIFSAHNKQLRINRRIRKRFEQKNVKNGTNPFLGLPNFRTMVLGDNDNQDDVPVVKSFQSLRRPSQKKVPPSILTNMVNPRVMKLKRGLSTLIGSETPLRRDTRKGSIDIQLFDAVVKDASNRDVREYYVIKIFGPNEAEKDFQAAQEEQKKEPVKKEHDIMSPVRASQNKKVAKKKKEPVKAAAKKSKVKYIEQNPGSIAEEAFSPYREDYITSITKLEAIKEESKRPKCMVKMFAAKRSDSNISENSSNHTHTLENIKTLKLVEESPVTPLTPIQKDLWKPVSISSPKFKSTFAPKIDQQESKLIEAMSPNNTGVNISHLTQQMDSPASAKNRVQIPKIYLTQNNSHKNLLPKLKIPGTDLVKSSSWGVQASSRMPTEPVAVSQLQREISSPLLLNAKSERLMYNNTEGDNNSPSIRETGTGGFSARFTTNSPYANTTLKKNSSSTFSPSSKNLLYHHARTMTSSVIKVNDVGSPIAASVLQESKFKPKLEIGSKTLRLKNLSLDGSVSGKIVQNKGKVNNPVLPTISPRGGSGMTSPRGITSPRGGITGSGTKKEFLVKLKE